MILPPSILRLRIRGEGHRFGIWLPLILVWPVVLVLALAVAPLVLIAAAVAWPFGWGRPLLLVGPAIFRIFCSLRGLEIDVRDGPQTVYVHIR